MGLSTGREDQPHSVVHTRSDTERVRTFLSKFHPTEFLIGELGAKPTPPQIYGPCVMLRKFRDNIYIIFVNMVAHLASVTQSVIM